MCSPSTVIVNSNSITITATVTDALSGADLNATNITLISNNVTTSYFNTTTNVTTNVTQSLNFSCSNITISGNTARISCNLTNGGNYTVKVYAADVLWNNKTINETFTVDTSCKPPESPSGSRGGGGGGGIPVNATVCGDGQCTGMETYESCSKDCPKPPECTKDSDCSGGKICKYNACVIKPECMKDSDCPEGNVCKGEKCMAVECTKDGNCPSDKICKDNNCVTKLECTTDSDCPGKECKNEKCVEKPPAELKISVPSDVTEGKEFTATVTSGGIPVSGVPVTYGGETKYTDSQGKVNFIGITGETLVLADKTGYVKTSASLQVTTVPVEEGCKTDSQCPSGQVCKNGICLEEAPSGTNWVQWAIIAAIVLIILLVLFLLLGRRKKNK